MRGLGAESHLSLFISVDYRITIRPFDVHVRGRWDPRRHKKWQRSSSFCQFRGSLWAADRVFEAFMSVVPMLSIAGSLSLRQSLASHKERGSPPPRLNHPFGECGTELSLELTENSGN